jgi:hypothetical protein
MSAKGLSMANDARLSFCAEGYSRKLKGQAVIGTLRSV